MEDLLRRRHGMGTASLLPFSIGQNQLTFKGSGFSLHLLTRIAIKSHCKGCEYREERNWGYFFAVNIPEMHSSELLQPLNKLLLDQHGIAKILGDSVPMILIPRECQSESPSSPS